LAAYFKANNSIFVSTIVETLNSTFHSTYKSTFDSPFNLSKLPTFKAAYMFFVWKTFIATNISPFSSTKQ
jgi:hypothetical protein